MRKQELLDSLAELMELVQALPDELAEKIKVDARYYMAHDLEELRWLSVFVAKPYTPIDTVRCEVDMYTGRIGKIEFTVCHQHLLGGLVRVVRDFSLIDDEAKDA